MTEEDITYKKAIEYTTQFQEPVGFSGHSLASQVDRICIRQHNTIIAILLDINSKLDKLIKGKEVEKPKNTDIEELIYAIKKSRNNSTKG